MTGSIPSTQGKREAEGAGPGANAWARWIVGVGASAGGLEAFTRLLKDLPPGTGMALVLVQHLDPEHESALVQLLSKATALPVLEAASDLAIQPDHIYVIPPKVILSIAQGVLKLSPRDAGSGASRTIDAFFEALADDQRERAIGVILSGTASDGTLGLEAIKAEGGITFTQDETARFDSMPRSAIAAGCVDFVLSPDRIAKELARIARHPYARDGSSTFALAGDEVQVNQRQALALGLGIHELATNAAKYGAFSVPSGKVDLSWDVVPSEKGPMLKIRWIERGGPMVKQPTRAGFGSMLIDRSLRAELDADNRRDFHPDGLRCFL